MALPAGLWLTLLLYVLGLRWPLLVALVAANARLLRLPAFLRSWTARAFLSALIAFALLQLAATAQFLVAPHSDFRALAALLVLVDTAVLLAAPREPAVPRPFVTWHDLWMCAPLLAFLAPFVPVVLHRGLVSTIGELGGIQVADATSHYSMVLEQAYYQHFDYADGAQYYPNGFHLAAAFTQQAVWNDVHALGWRGNALLYFGQYVITLGALGAALYLFAVGLLANLRRSAPGALTGLLIAISLAPALAFFYFVPFFYRGFVNYAYVSATLAAGICFLVDAGDEGRWWRIAGFLLLAFGASASWPLFTPVILLTAAGMMVAPGWRQALGAGRERLGALGALAVAAAQAVPVLLQFHYGGRGVVADLSLRVTLFPLHAVLLLIGTLVLATILVDARAEPAVRRRLALAVTPPLALAVGIALLEEFQAGVAGYYAVKVALPVEMILLAAAAAALWSRAGPPARWGPGALAVAVVPLLVTTLALAADTNPLGDFGNVFRDYSQTGKPPFYEHDLSRLVALGSAGRLDHVNATAVHARPDGSLYQHEPLPFWADLMQYQPASPQDRAAWACAGRLYVLLTYGDVGSAANQSAAAARLDSCARLARERGLTFYLVTDPASADRIRRQFGSVATIID